MKVANFCGQFIHQVACLVPPEAQGSILSKSYVSLRPKARNT